MPKQVIHTSHKPAVPPFSIESAGHKMIPLNRVPLALSHETLKQLEATILKNISKYDTINYVYVVDKNNRLKGVMSIKDIFKFPKSTAVEAIMTREPISVHPHTDQEHVAIKALRHNLKALPVIDHNNILLGIVPSDVILSILHAEHTEDFLRLAGVDTFKDPMKSILNASAGVHIIKRLPWLVLGLLGGLLAAFVVRYFDAILQKEIMLAAFIPSIVYLADAVGTQTQTIFIRSLALDHKLDMMAYVARESVISVAIAFILSAMIALFSYLWWGQSIFMYIFAISVFITIVVAMAIAICLPFFLSKVKADPAIASGPFATVVRDILSLLIYFSVSQLLLAGL